MNFRVGDATSALALQIYPDVTKLEKTVSIFFFNDKHFHKFVSEKSQKNLLSLIMTDPLQFLALDNMPLLQRFLQSDKD